MQFTNEGGIVKACGLAASVFLSGTRNIHVVKQSGSSNNINDIQCQ